MLALPFFVAFEFLGAFIETLGYIAITRVGRARDRQLAVRAARSSRSRCLAGLLLSISAVLLEDFAFRRYGRLRDLLRLVAYGVLENIGYRQLITAYRVAGSSPISAATRTGARSSGWDSDRPAPERVRLRHGPDASASAPARRAAPADLRVAKRVAERLSRAGTTRWPVVTISAISPYIARSANADRKHGRGRSTPAPERGTARRSSPDRGGQVDRAVASSCRGRNGSPRRHRAMCTHGTYCLPPATGPPIPRRKNGSIFASAPRRPRGRRRRGSRRRAHRSRRRPMPRASQAPRPRRGSQSRGRRPRRAAPRRAARRSRSPTGRSGSAAPVLAGARAGHRRATRPEHARVADPPPWRPSLHRCATGSPSRLTTASAPPTQRPAAARRSGPATRGAPPVAEQLPSASRHRGKRHDLVPGAQQSAGYGTADRAGGTCQDDAHQWV